MANLHLFQRRADPPPAKVNAITLTVDGTVLWGVATVVIAVLAGQGRVDENWLHVCYAGLAMGVLGVGWGFVHEHRGRRRST
ncbi:uncharacterized protein DUF2530 [Georgenia soli]|uniref:Uncharacterized protein DUF2530 n=1 Tax=Georgenia soli TaxID=638953 RepID=A0A2A9ELD5_9MICO|nr:DUF2530 domain-containing protein [Georgenia soli]PFG39065.1 uncharacterized protein DUF2530 [Georgenia soli]